MRKYLCISNNCRIFASEKETNNKLNPKTRKGTKIMKTIISNNNKSISVDFFANGGRVNEIEVFVNNDGRYMFSIGKVFKSMKAAKRSTIKRLGEMGITFDDKEMVALNF